MSLLLFYSRSATRKDIIWQNNTESLKTINVANLYGSMALVQVFCSLLDNVVLDLLCPPSPLPPFPRLSLLAVLCVLHYETSPLPRSELSSKSAQTSCGGHPAVKDSHSVFLCKYLLPRSLTKTLWFCVCVGGGGGGHFGRGNDCRQLPKLHFLWGVPL